MSYTFNPFTSNFDFWSNDFGTGGFYMTDADGHRWHITIATDGTFTATDTTVTVGTPMGLLLALTYAT